ncbi:SDR family oxidoreductase [Rhizobium deserti]|uniref:SDR family oxidoreductase n=1 Tax=Rhizobium deserti TaxID=2547961 RepID=A0A4R5UBC0_9HYPH|nr:SDR family oxidoreductase [Rhizobium deserti]TDK32150.1 SDR family oxidoreductase [Rhizobium deserti]
MTKTIFVSGATGNTGRLTVQALLAKGAKVVAGVHSPEKADALKSLGAEVRPFDLSDIGAMTDAMRGTEGLYLVTPVSQHTETLTSNMVQAAKVAGVSHVVKLSGLDVDKGDFAFAQWHFAAEEVIRASGLDWTFLHPNSFIQNFYGALPTIKVQGVYYNTYATAPVSFVDARDIGDVAATALLSRDHVGQIYNLTGPDSLSRDDVVALFSEAAGKSVQSVDVGGSQLIETFLGFGMPQTEAAATAELLGYTATGRASRISPDVETLLGRAPRSLAQWTQENAQAFR